MRYKTITVPDHEATGKYYAEMRRDAGLTQRQLAKKIGRRQGYLSDLECGRRRWQPWAEEAYKKYCQQPTGA